MSETMSTKELKALAAELADEKGLVDVVAKTICMDQGIRHAPGESFKMDQRLVASHVRAGQIELPTAKSQDTPADKAVKASPRNK
jgi:hypothetical protein